MTDWEQLFADIDYRYTDGIKDTGFETLKARLPKVPELWSTLAKRGSVREFAETPPTYEELQLISALALATPTKSDLQQRDIIIVTETKELNAIKRLLVDQAWVSGAPVIVIICANNRRQRLIHALRGHPFVNDHLDAFFNASVDAGIAIAAFVLAAEAAGFATCPISAIRNYPDKTEEILNLPDYVFPVAALAVGHPAQKAEPSLRLPLAATVHHNSYSEDTIQSDIDAYDRHRANVQPYDKQRREEELGRTDPYTWSEDKARQYNLPERESFGAFVKRKGFRLE